ncbi:hypothetical protein EVAR_90379_1 [Eumeta japonica]|uniref:Uncharacterized protein n=1 Tax=Eumeta variegata TaxID=151549 RepID=A0A4C1Y8C5_EUMVA|nr:hypothetical protein EVAR_90379_1 [Eumeta japonica]
MSNVWMRRRLLGNTQLSIPEIALAHDIFAETHLPALPGEKIVGEYDLEIGTMIGNEIKIVNGMRNRMDTRHQQQQHQGRNRV